MTVVQEKLRPRLLIVSYLYPPYNYVGALRPARFVKYLSRWGCQIAVLSAGPSRSVEATDQNVTVHRLRGELDEYVPLFREKLVRKALQLLGLRLHNWGAAWIPGAVRYALFSLKRRDVVFTTAPPTAALVVGLVLKRIWRCVWIADFRDPFVGGRSAFGRACENFLEWLVFHQADVVIANTELVGAKWREQYPRLAGKIVVLPNGFDPEDAVSAVGLPIRPYRLLSHVGSVYFSRHPDLVIAALDGLLQNGRIKPSAIRMDFVGPFERGSVRDLAAFDRAVHNGSMRVRPAVSRTEARQIMAESDYLILLDLLDGETAGMHIPAKLFEYIQIGKPILACAKRGSAMEAVLAASGIRYVMLYTDDSKQQLEDKLLALLNTSTAVADMEPEFVRQYAAPSQAERLLNLVNAELQDD